MTKPTSIDKDDLNDFLTPHKRRHCFERLGFSFNGHRAGSDGEVSGLRLPPSIHEDTNGSVSLNLHTGQVHDHGGHFSGDLYQLVQDVRGTDFPGALRWVADAVGYEPPEDEKPDWNPFKDGREVAAYDYTDERGDVLFQVVRYEPPASHPAHPDKTFLQRRYDPDASKASADGYAWGLAETRRVLYRLSAVLAAAEDGERVFIVEGEKDVHTLEDAGFAATCNPMGAGSWRGEYTEALAGADVVLLPDNDEAGHEHAGDVTGALDGETASVRVVQLPGLSDGEDVTDWLDGSGGTPALLRKLAAGAEPYAPDDQDDGDDSNQSKTQAQKLIDMAEEADLFHTPRREPYATYPIDGHRETSSLRSPDFREWLIHRFYQQEGKPPSAQAEQDARGVLSAEAKFGGPQREVALRTASHENAIYIDLGGEDWKAAKVTEEGWEVVDETPVRFRRTPAMNALPEPRRGGSLDLLKPYVRLKQEKDFVLLWACLVQYLRPEGPYPPLAFRGEHGTGKSTVTRMVRALVDPSTAPLRSQPRNNRDLMVSADNNWILTFDNLSGVRQSLSDALCRLSTGGGFSTRRLHSNRTEEIFDAMRPQILNGIEDVATSADLSDRSVVIELDVIPEEERQSETNIWYKFGRDHPLILGALLDALASALANKDDVELERLPRMADFAVWTVAAEPSFPVPEGTFMEVYAGNRVEVVEKAVANDTVAAAIRVMLNDVNLWKGKTSSLVEDLKPYLPDPDNVPKDYPSSYQEMGARLRRIMPGLRKVGIEKVDDERSSVRRFALRNTAQSSGGSAGSGGSGV